MEELEVVQSVRVIEVERCVQGAEAAFNRTHASQETVIRRAQQGDESFVVIDLCMLLELVPQL